MRFFIPTLLFLSARKPGDKVQEATQLVKTSDGRLLLTSSNTNVTSIQNLTCN